MGGVSTPGEDFARALAAKDYDRIAELLHPRVDFRGMTPRRIWEAGTPSEVVTEVLNRWFEDTDEIESLDKLESETFADRERVGYRFTVRNPDGRFLVDQQAYLTAEEGRIVWIRVMCAGYRRDPKSD